MHGSMNVKQIIIIISIIIIIIILIIKVSCARRSTYFISF